MKRNMNDILGVLICIAVGVLMMFLATTRPSEGQKKDYKKKKDDNDEDFNIAIS